MADHFEWTTEAQEALDKVKQLLTKALILVPRPMGNHFCSILQPPGKWSVQP